MDQFRHLTYIGLLLTITGCMILEAKETTFLRTAEDRATQEEVQQRLGPPSMINESQSGESIWVYQIWDWQPGNRFTATGAWCDEYLLTFDSQSILRRWTHGSHFHGGEAFPDYCVPGHSASTGS